MRYLIVTLLAVVMVMGVAIGHAQTTPNLNLNLPAANSANWNIPTNQNWTALDTLLGAFGHPLGAGTIIYWNGSAWVALAGNTSGTNFLQENVGIPSWNNPISIPPSAGLCQVSTGNTQGAYGWGSCTGAASTAWANLTAGTNSGSGSFIIGTGSSISTIGSGQIAATSAPWVALTGFPSACTSTVVTGVGITLSCNKVTSSLVDTTVAVTGVDVNSSSQVVATHLTAPLPVLQGGTGSTSPSLVGGSNITIGGSWPNQTISASASGIGAIDVNGTPISSSSLVNFLNSAATNGVTLTLTNTSSGNIQLGLTGTLTNAGLTNPATTVNSQSCTLGSTCTIPFQTNSVNNTSQAGLNHLTSTTNSVGLTATPVNSGTNQMKIEITGGAYTGTAAGLSGTPLLPNGTTAATQAIADNTTKVATDAFVIANSVSNPMTTLGDLVYGGASGAFTRLAGPTNPGTYTVTETPLSGAATAEIFSLPGVPINPQTGTSYTYLATDATTDRAGYTSFSNASSIAVTLPQAGSTGFGSNWVNVSCDIGAGTATITPTTSTISYTTGTGYTSAASTIALTTGQCAFIYSNNTNYFAIKLAGGGGGGTPAYPVTITGGVSGGIPYFSSTTVESASALLTANSPVLGGGAGLAPVTVAGITSDGTSVLTLGVASGAVGGLAFHNASTGTLTLNPPTGALGTVTVTIPDATDTLVNLAGTQTLTNKSIAASEVNSGTLAIANGGTNASSATAGSMPNASSTTASTWTKTPTLGASGTVGTLAFGNATTGTVTLGTVTGALGSVTASLPANTGTLAELNLAQTFTATQTFGTILPTSVGVGTSPPTCTPGTAGADCYTEGTAPTAVSGVDDWWADSTKHAFMTHLNGGSPAMPVISMPASIRSTGLVAAVTTATLCAASAGACNQAGTYQVHIALYQSGAACTTNTTGGVSPTLTWTDGNGTAHTAVAFPIDTQSSSTAITTTMLFNQTGAGIGTVFGTGNFVIDTNGSIIQYAIGFAQCSVTGTATYAASLTVDRLQ